MTKVYAAAPPRKRVVMFCSNPQHEPSRLRLDAEYRAMCEVTERAWLEVLSPERDVAPHWLPSLLDGRHPYIIHFSGHGDDKGRLAFTNEAGKSHAGKREFAEIFRNYQYQVKCVVLNTCHSEEQARILSVHVDYVVGVSGKIEDSAAISFSKGFYECLAAQAGDAVVDIKTAFRRGRTGIGLEDLPDGLVLRLYRNGQLCRDAHRDSPAGEAPIDINLLPGKVESCRVKMIDQLVCIIEACDGLAAHIGNAHAEWRGAACDDAKGLAGRLIEETSIVEFGEVMFGCMCAARVSADPISIANGVLDIYESTIPFVVARHVRQQVLEGPLETMSVGKPAVLDAVMAAREGRRIKWHARDTFAPAHYVEVSASKHPDKGASDEARTEAIVNGWMQRDKDAFSHYGEMSLRSRVRALNRSLGLTKRTGGQPYGVSFGDHEEERRYLLSLRGDEMLSNLEVFVAKMQEEDKDLEIDVLEPMRKIYLIYDEITRVPS